MNIFQRLLQPLRQAVQCFFVRDVQLRRGARGVEFALMEPGTSRQSSRKTTATEQAQSKERVELNLMQSQLAAVLDDLPETRSALRHLVFVEQALLRKGWKALHKLPLDVMQRAQEQLEGLITNWSAEGLANLRSKLAVAIIDREHTDPSAEADDYNTKMPLEAQEHVAAASELSALDPGAVHLADVQVLTEADALAAAYAELGLNGAEPSPAPRPAALAAVALAQAQAQATATLQAAFAQTTAESSLEPVEYHPELGTQSARAQPRENLAGKSRLAPIKLRELQS